jgi:putative toxin-antitoxin system antitoxin component (TIGR02293 family)
MVEPAAVANILGLRGKVSSLLQLDDAVSRGLSKQSITRVVTRLAANERDARTLRNSLVPLATWKRTKGRLSRAASERAERLARVLALAEHVLSDAEKGQRWMTRPHPELGGKTPAESATTELGARAAEYVLQALFFGLPV